MRYDPCTFRPPMLWPSHPNYREEHRACNAYHQQIRERENELSRSEGVPTAEELHLFFLSGGPVGQSKVYSGLVLQSA